MKKVLIVDDEKSIQIALSFALEDTYEVATASNSQEAFKLLSLEEFDVVLLDMKLGNENGLELIKSIKSMQEDIQILIVTAYGSVDSVIEATRKGAFYFLTKPVNSAELNVLINKAIEYKDLKDRVNKLSKEALFPEIIGNSKPMSNIKEKVSKIKDTDYSVLITGESGTGKEVIARAIHYNSNRKNYNFEAINCAAIPHNLLESELFGHEKGAFTGATTRRPGRIEVADKGTLFLDEIGDMDLLLQAKLLRVIQEKEFVSVGSNKTKKIDVRIVAATNKNLKEEIEKGRFREDLFYRLNVINIDLPPLRERVEDISLLTKHFLEKTRNKLNNQNITFSQQALKYLERYSFPGNVRELVNIVERAAVFADDNEISLEDLPDEVVTLKSGYLPPDNFSTKDKLVFDIGTDLRSIEREVIVKTLEKNDFNRRKTADILGIGERTLRYKLKDYNV